MILDTNESGVKHATQKTNRVTLPRIFEAILKCLILLTLVQSPQEMVNGFVLDYKDAFWQIPLRDEEQRFFCATAALAFRFFRGVEARGDTSFFRGVDCFFSLSIKILQATAAWEAIPSVGRKLRTVLRKSSDLTRASTRARSSLVDSFSATSPQRQGNTLANKPQAGRPVKKDDISLALYASGLFSRLFFASALMLCNEALLTRRQSHSSKF